MALSAAQADRITDTALAFRREYPRVSTGSSLGWTARESLEELARLCGLSVTLCAKANTNDLISIYLVALKDPQAALRTASKVSMRLDDTLLSAEPEPFIPYTAAPREPAPKAPSVDLNAIRDMIRQEVREGAVEPLQAALERTVDTFFAALAKAPAKPWTPCG